MLDRLSRLWSGVATRSVSDPDPERRREAERLRGAFLAEIASRARDSDHLIFGIVPTEFAAGQAVLDSEPAVQVAFIRLTLDRTLDVLTRAASSQSTAQRKQVTEGFRDIWRLEGLITQLLRRSQPYTDADVAWFLERLAQSGVDARQLQTGWFSLTLLLRGIQRTTKCRALRPDELRSLAQIRENVADAAATVDGRRLLALLDELLGVAGSLESPIDISDDWGQRAARALDALDAQQRDGWLAVLRFAKSASGSKPSKKWLQQATEQIEQFGQERFVETLVAWLELLHQPNRHDLRQRPDGLSQSSEQIADGNGDILKGLVWAASTVDDPRLVGAIGDAALACFRKIPNYGARSTKAGNACLWALGASPDFASVAELQRLWQRIKLPSARKQIEMAIDAAAHQRGLTREDLNDLAVPEFGLVDGIIRRPLGDVVAEITVERGDSVSLAWRRADGRTQASVPAEVKRDFPEEVKAIRKLQKDVRDALPAQRARVEGLLLADRCWPLERWRDSYLDHPLLSLIARRLIWSFDRDGRQVEGCWLDGLVVTVDDQPIDWLDAGTTVRLWHPIASPPESVLAWRHWLERHEVTQPFKQAHREVYLLTDAERATDTYSNRFAAHILRQHQLTALCQQRGWTYQLQGGWDSANAPTIQLPRWDLRVEFWVDPPAGADAAMSASGIYLYVSTDQVRFAQRDSREPMRLVDVPPLVFSEMMRDIDLFVGVCSVGADPTWLDGGADGRQQGWDQYWWDFSFGELSASAATRREVLERLVPRLAIADRCRLEGRFLIVRGNLRTYKIHLGSGNILMEPNDQYLCIVPGRGVGAPGREHLFLPFDGDATLSVIISKAFLLADDRSISDPSITRQIVFSRA